MWRRTLLLSVIMVSLKDVESYTEVDYPGPRDWNDKPGQPKGQPISRGSYLCAQSLEGLLQLDERTLFSLEPLKSPLMQECFRRRNAFPVLETERRQGTMGNALHFLLSLLADKADRAVWELLLAPGHLTLDDICTRSQNGLSCHELRRQGINSPNTVPFKGVVASYRRSFEKVLKSILSENRSMLNAKDSLGYTPLLFAVSEGLEWVVEVLVSGGANPNKGTDILGKTALHLSIHDRSLYNILVHGGAKSKGARDWFERTVDDLDKHVRLRVSSSKHACTERNQEDGVCILPDQKKSTVGSDSSIAGWRPRPPQSKNPPRCDVPTISAARMSPEVFFRDFLYVSQPVLIVDAAKHEGWEGLRKTFTRANLLQRFGDVKTAIGRIPYPSKFGLSSESSTIRDYVETYMGKQRENDIDKDLIPYLALSAPREMSYIQNSGKRFHLPSFAQLFANKSYALDTQLFLGPEGAGSPMHFHNNAFNIVVFGAKRWFLLPPTQRVYSKVKAQNWAHSQTRRVRKSVLECVQNEGDIMYVPFAWAHGVTNLADTVALTLEWGYREEHLNQLRTFLFDEGGKD
mmetsp:Transcript_2583/g.5889  ORF Transcript_2583/g.5889 Transcript_2583/m.5889 type:complete len:575 (-) Transcript_2583:159-1883(-)